MQNVIKPVLDHNADRALTEIAAPRIADTGAVVLGGGFRLPVREQNRVADRGAVVLGGGFRLPAVRHTRVADRGTIVLGGGFRLPVRDRSAKA